MEEDRQLNFKKNSQLKMKEDCQLIKKNILSSKSMKMNVNWLQKNILNSKWEKTVNWIQKRIFNSKWKKIVKSSSSPFISEKMSIYSVCPIWHPSKYPRILPILAADQAILCHPSHILPIQRQTTLHIHLIIKLSVLSTESRLYMEIFSLHCPCFSSICQKTLDTTEFLKKDSQLKTKHDRLPELQKNCQLRNEKSCQHEKQNL